MMKFLARMAEKDAKCTNTACAMWWIEKQKKI